MAKNFGEIEKLLCRRLKKQLLNWGDHLSFREIKSNDDLVRAIEEVEARIKGRPKITSHFLRADQVVPFRQLIA